MALDFIRVISTFLPKKEIHVVEPEFICIKSKDLMIRGGNFYAIWDEANLMWHTSKADVYRLIDEAIDEYVKSDKELNTNGKGIIVRKYATQFGSGIPAKFNNYVKAMDDNYIPLDSKLVFLSDPYVRENYSTKRLPYDLIEAPTPNYDRLLGVLYSDTEREKLEWGIGAVLSGEYKDVQKFFVLYGSHGTGKSTVLHIIEKLFKGYCASFTSAALGKNNSSFALEVFKDNPLVAIEHDGDLSKIDDNTKLNQIVSHERMPIDVKFTNIYSMEIRSIMFIGSNKPVKITDAKSGLLRRLIDVSPTGNTLKKTEYKKLFDGIDFELGGIAYKCLHTYLNDRTKYDTYRPIKMISQTNDFYNFILDSYDTFEKQDYILLKNAWTMYNEYCQNAGLTNKYSMTRFGIELENYFEYRYPQKQVIDPDGKRLHLSNVFEGFKSNIFKPKLDIEEMNAKLKKLDKITIPEWLTLVPTIEDSIFKEAFEGSLAQYAVVDAVGTEKPSCKWDNCTTTVDKLVTTKLHYVLPKDPHYIFVDFDLKDENGQKSLAKNLEAAAKFPPTYAEVSKGGQGLHLHYIYDGNPNDLDPIYAPGIEVKVMLGKASIRRKLTLCNGLPIAHINSGLPLKNDNFKYGKDGKKVLNKEAYMNERAMRTIISDCLRKSHHGHTTPEVNFIKEVLDSAYNGGVTYDVTDMRPAVMEFASRSTNGASKCMEIVADLHFSSDEASPDIDDKSDSPIIFYDVEIFPNLFVICYLTDDGKPGEAKKSEVRALINPTMNDVRMLVDKGKLVGFNNLEYDNHMLYGAMLGYTTEELYALSKRIIDKSKNCKFKEAYNLSYTDIHDFANTKQSLKKWEIEMGIHHQELGLPWDKPVPEELWDTVADYCKNDVVATKALFYHLEADWTARKVLSKLSGLTVNTKTNAHSIKIIFGNDKNPQKQFNYVDLSEMFPGYKFEFGKSTYRGEETGEGGYVYAEPGIYHNVALLDIASMHPSSIEAMNMFGPYTQRYSEIKQARVCVKHGDLEGLKTKLNGELLQFIPPKEDAGYSDFMSALAYALKIVINSVYGLTAAKFDNPCKDPRNIDNIVAKRGALFMINLKHEVWKRGYKVAHIKTDSIKIPDADEEIIKFVSEYGKKYGYTFEHEATYEKMCLVNDAVYIAKYGPNEGKHSGEWTATGKEFAVPYIFKTVFSHEEINFEDLCETYSVSTGGGLYLDMNEDVCKNLPEVTAEIKALESKAKRTVKKDPNAELDESGRVLKDDLAQYEMLLNSLDTCHNYIFVGRTGQFTPVRPGFNGGELVREKDGKYSYAAGSKGWRWFESEELRGKGRDNEIDMEYFKALVDGALSDIAKYGDVDEFIK